MLKTVRIILAVFGFMLCSQVSAQYAYNVFCVEGTPEGGFHCKLKPDSFTPWRYDSGVGTYDTEGAAVQSIIKHYYSEACNVSYTLGGYEITHKDDFIQSQEEIRKTKPVYVNWGYYTREGRCEPGPPATHHVWAYRFTICSAPSDRGDIVFGSSPSSAGSSACMRPVILQTVKVQSCTVSDLSGAGNFFANNENTQKELDLQDDSANGLDFERHYSSFMAQEEIKYPEYYFGYFRREYNGNMGLGWTHKGTSKNPSYPGAPANATITA